MAGGCQLLVLRRQALLCRVKQDQARSGLAKQARLVHAAGLSVAHRWKHGGVRFRRSHDSKVMAAVDINGAINCWELPQLLDWMDDRR